MAGFKQGSPFCRQPAFSAFKGNETPAAAAEKDVSTVYFDDDGTIPNNPTLPVLLYHSVFKGHEDQIKTTFQKHNWKNNWEWTIFPYHHFHSNSHEVLGVSRGHAQVQLGGPNGKIFTVSAGDVMLLPAGTGHRLIESSDDFAVIGGYPNGRDYDLHRKETAELKENIRNVDVPETDPVYGSHGPVFEIWRK
ncbi:cupin domain-containing protein [Heyndrickxia acidiproducens]|uniref:cupin domain-containing protein n=1 Tax=Heyndrickxia acidiproducens TaxID=1121084 RepID=UPI00037278C3|nr:cupin domain-containing protein [Heyndrickxia acidiproducens]